MGEIVLEIIRYIFELALKNIVTPLLDIMETVALSPETIEKMPFINDLYTSMQGIGLGLLILIASWQAFRSMFIGWGIVADEPQKIAIKTFIAGFLLFYIKDIMMKIIASASLMISWITDNLVSRGFGGSGVYQLGFISNFDWMETALEAGGLIMILTVVLVFNCAILFWKMFLRLCMLALLLICSPLAVASMVSKSTEGFWQGFIKLFAGNIVIQLIQSASVAAIIITLASMTQNFSTNSSGRPELVFSMMLIIALVSITNKLEDIVRDISINVGIGRDMQGALGRIQSAAYTASSFSNIAVRFAHK